MKVLVTFKSGMDGQGFHTRHFEMEQTEYHLLKTDFIAYLNGEDEAVKGASYHYLDNDSLQAREIAMRFEDVLYVECIVQEHAQGQGPNALGQIVTSPLEGAGGYSTTGPLSSRLTGSGEGEG